MLPKLTTPGKICFSHAHLTTFISFPCNGCFSWFCSFQTTASSQLLCATASAHPIRTGGILGHRLKFCHLKNQCRGLCLIWSYLQKYPGPDFAFHWAVCSKLREDLSLPAVPLKNRIVHIFPRRGRRCITKYEGRVAGSASSFWRVALSHFECQLLQHFLSAWFLIPSDPTCKDSNPIL